MNTGTIVLIIVLLVLVAAGVALYFVGKKAQKKQEEQQQQIEASRTAGYAGAVQTDRFHADYRQKTNEDERCRFATAGYGFC